MEKLESFGESAIPWIDDDLTKASTSLPEVLAEEETAIGTLVIIVVSAVLSITLLFLMAVFIDCRQQKLAKIKLKTQRKVLKITIPKFNRPSNDVNGDSETFADKMHTEDSTPSTASVIV